MAHVHGAKPATAAPKMAGMAEAATGHGKMGGSMGGMERMMHGGSMEGGPMGSMMGGMAMEGGHMASMMGGGMEAGGMGKMMAGMGGGAALSAASASGKGGLSRLLANPWILFGLGFAAGFLVHKYRREIIAASGGIAGSAEPENLEELVAECNESAEEPKETGKPKSRKGG